MSFTRWAGLPTPGRPSFIYHSLPRRSIRPLFLAHCPSVRPPPPLPLPAGGGSPSSSIRATDRRLMTPTNREETVCLTDDDAPVEADRRMDCEANGPHPLQVFVLS